MQAKSFGAHAQGWKAKWLTRIEVRPFCFTQFVKPLEKELMALTFDANYYLTQRPDVFQAFVATAGSTGLTWAQFAEQHYNNHGRFEGSNPNAVFNTDEYLAANVDVAAAGVNPFQHYLTHGVYEGRAPSASFPARDAFDWQTYVNANPDLGEAGIDTAEEAYVHFVMHGQFEGRPGTPAIDHGLPGDTIVLTSGIDAGTKFTGGAGNDRFLGDGTTVQAADQLVGGLGDDTLEYYGAAKNVVLPNMTGIENLVLVTPAADTEGLNTSTITDLKTVTFKDMTVGTELKGITISGSQTLGFDAVTGGKDVTAATASSATSVALAIANGSNLGTVKVNGAAAKEFQVASTGSKANTIKALANDSADESKVVITGTQQLTITDALAATVKTIDASGNSGGVVVTAGNADVTFTGGAGADTISFAAGQFTNKDVLDGGAGVDTIVINDTTPNYDAINGAKNFEVLRLATTGATLDLSKITNGINQFEVGQGDLTETFQNSLSSTKYTINNTGGNTGTVTIQNKVGELGTSVTIDNQDAAAKTLAALSLTGATQVELVSSGKAGNIITTLTNADNSSFTVKGNADLQFALSAGTATGSKVDASAFTGALNVTGSSKADILIGGSGNDTIATGGGADEITGGAGIDTFNVAASVNSSQTVDVIIHGIEKGEKIIFANNGAETFTATAVDVSGAASLDAAIALAASGDGGTNGIIKWFNYGGDTYVVEDMTDGVFAAATDLVVKIVGTYDLSKATYVAGSDTLTY
jgi:Ca2+-binding RTX toxin-like protein